MQILIILIETKIQMDSQLDWLNLKTNLIIINLGTIKTIERVIIIKTIDIKEIIKKIIFIIRIITIMGEIIQEIITDTMDKAIVL
jgi:hypothetical protein